MKVRHQKLINSDMDYSLQCNNFFFKFVGDMSIFGITDTKARVAALFTLWNKTYTTYVPLDSRLL